MRAPFLLLPLILLCACAQQPPVANANQRLEAVKPAISAYELCMDNAATDLAATPATATEAAIAAQGACAREFTAADLAIHHYMINSARLAHNRQWAAERADKHVADLRRRAQESVVSRVIQYRTQGTAPRYAR